MLGIIGKFIWSVPDADISNYSTIDTPVYNEKLLDYLERYPEKTPAVVAISSFYGTMQVP